MKFNKYNGYCLIFSGKNGNEWGVVEEHFTERNWISINLQEQLCSQVCECWRKFYKPIDYCEGCKKIHLSIIDAIYKPMTG